MILRFCAQAQPGFRKLNVCSASGGLNKSAACRTRARPLLEAVFQGELDGPRRQPCVNEVLFSQRLELFIRKPDAIPGDAEMRPIEEVEEFAPEFDFMPVAESEVLVDR